MAETKDIVELRKEIDAIDTQLWSLIQQRVDVARQIGEWKRQHDEPVVQAERFQEVVNHCQHEAETRGLSQEVVQGVMEALHKESVRVEL